MSMTRIANEGYSSQDDLEGHDKFTESSIKLQQNIQESVVDLEEEKEVKGRFYKRIESAPLLVSVEMDTEENQVDVVYKSFHNTNVDGNHHPPPNPVCENNKDKRRSMEQRRRRKESRKRAHTLPKGDIISEKFFEGTLTPTCEKEALDTLFDENQHNQIPLVERIQHFDEGLAQQKTVRIEIPKELMIQKSIPSNDYSTIDSHLYSNDKNITQNTSPSHTNTYTDFHPMNDKNNISTTTKKTVSCTSNNYTKSMNNQNHDNPKKQSHTEVSSGCQCVIL